MRNINTSQFRGIFMSYKEIGNLRYDNACLPAGKQGCVSVVSVEYCSGRGLCVGTITRSPTESGVSSECDCEVP